jgi:hypothetical protein
MTRFPNKPLCPVCHNPVTSSTPVITSHQDKAGRHCPASGEPFRIALTDHLTPPGGGA